MATWSQAVLDAVRREARKSMTGHFTRQSLIENELSNIVREVKSIGRTPEQTLSRELQELSTAGYIEFVDSNGTYRYAGESASHTIAAKYNVDGFRSLRKFSISIMRGLNVLVGPNGSGKTNFIDFLTFLSVIVSRDASTAVSLAGGLPRVFSQESNKKQSPRIIAHVSGTANINSGWEDPENRVFYDYEYLIEIRFSKIYSSIYISNEKLKIFSLHNIDEISSHSRRPVGYLQVRRHTPSPDVEPKLSISPRLAEPNARNPLRFLRRSIANPSKPRLATVDDEVVSPAIGAPDQSLLSARPLRPALDAVRIALSRGRAFNLSPALARVPDELSRPPGIASDGSGLSSTLFHLQKRGGVSSPADDIAHADHSAFLAIVDTTRLVLPELISINVSSDPHSGRYMGSVSIGGSESDSIKVPLSSVSDGTIKWLSVITMLHTRRGLFSIEEPENFLHPTMQRFLIQEIREIANSQYRGRGDFIVVSTHSETIINEVKPLELVIFEFNNCRTVCRRPRNIRLIEEEINRTGFGLGHYYASNAIS